MGQHCALQDVFGGRLTALVHNAGLYVNMTTSSAEAPKNLEPDEEWNDRIYGIGALTTTWCFASTTSTMHLIRVLHQGEVLIKLRMCLKALALPLCEVMQDIAVWFTIDIARLSPGEPQVLWSCTRRLLVSKRDALYDP